MAGDDAHRLFIWCNIERQNLARGGRWIVFRDVRNHQKKMLLLQRSNKIFRYIQNVLTQIYEYFKTQANKDF